LSRLITTFDEVPPYRPTRFTSRTIMVFPYSKRVPPKSFVQPRKMKTEVFKYSRLRKDSAVHVSLSSSSLVKQPGTRRPHSRSREVRKTLFRRQMTTDGLSAVASLIKKRSFTGTKTCLGRGPRQRRAQWAGYKPARSALSTVASINRRIIRQILRRKETAIFAGLAPHLSHIPATF